MTVYDFTFEGERWTVDALHGVRPAKRNAPNPIRISKVEPWLYEGQEYKVSMIAIPHPAFVRSSRIKALKPGTDLTRKQRADLYEHWVTVVREAAKVLPD